MGLFDYNWSDGQDSLWDNRRSWWMNLGNLAWNTGSAALGGGVGFFAGGPLGAAAGAAAGWSAGNQAFDGLEYLTDGTYEGNAVIDYGATAAAITGGTAGFIGSSAAGGAAAATGGTATAAGSGGGAAGTAATAGGSGMGIGSMLQNQAVNLGIDALQQGGMSAYNAYAQKAQEAQERREKIDYYERNKAASLATYDAQLDSTALRFLQNDLAIRQQAFDFEMTGRMARSGAVAATGASNLAGVSARETLNEISAQTSKGARRYQTQRKNQADAFFADIRNLQVARDNQINSVTDPRQFEVSDDIKALQNAAPWIEFGVGMVGRLGDAIGQNQNVSDITQGIKTYG